MPRGMAPSQRGLLVLLLLMSFIGISIADEPAAIANNVTLSCDEPLAQIGSDDALVIHVPPRASEGPTSPFTSLVVSCPRGAADGRNVTFVAYPNSRLVIASWTQSGGAVTVVPPPIQTDLIDVSVHVVQSSDIRAVGGASDGVAVSVVSPRGSVSNVEIHVQDGSHLESDVTSGGGMATAASIIALDNITGARIRVAAATVNSTANIFASSASFVAHHGAVTSSTVVIESNAVATASSIGPSDGTAVAGSLTRLRGAGTELHRLIVRDAHVIVTESTLHASAAGTRAHAAAASVVAPLNGAIRIEGLQLSASHSTVSAELVGAGRRVAAAALGVVAAVAADFADTPMFLDFLSIEAANSVINASAANTFAAGSVAAAGIAFSCYSGSSASLRIYPFARFLRATATESTVHASSGSLSAVAVLGISASCYTLAGDQRCQAELKHGSVLAQGSTLHAVARGDAAAVSIAGVAAAGVSYEGAGRGFAARVENASMLLDNTIATASATTTTTASSDASACVILGAATSVLLKRMAIANQVRLLRVNATAQRSTLDAHSGQKGSSAVVLGAAGSSIVDNALPSIIEVKESTLALLRGVCSAEVANEGCAAVCVGVASGQDCGDYSPHSTHFGASATVESSWMLSLGSNMSSASTGGRGTAAASLGVSVGVRRERAGRSNAGFAQAHDAQFVATGSNVHAQVGSTGQFNGRDQASSAAAMGVAGGCALHSSNADSAYTPYMPCAARVSRVAFIVNRTNATAAGRHTAGGSAVAVAGIAVGSYTLSSATMGGSFTWKPRSTMGLGGAATSSVLELDIVLDSAQLNSSLRGHGSAAASAGVAVASHSQSVAPAGALSHSSTASIVSVNVSVSSIHSVLSAFAANCASVASIGGSAHSNGATSSSAEVNVDNISIALTHSTVLVQAGEGMKTSNGFYSLASAAAVASSGSLAALGLGLVEARVCGCQARAEVWQFSAGDPKKPLVALLATPNGNFVNDQVVGSPAALPTFKAYMADSNVSAYLDSVPVTTEGVLSSVMVATAASRVDAVFWIDNSTVSSLLGSCMLVYGDSTSTIAVLHSSHVRCADMPWKPPTSIPSPSRVFVSHDSSLEAPVGTQQNATDVFERALFGEVHTNGTLAADMNADVHAGLACAPLAFTSWYVPKHVAEFDRPKPARDRSFTTSRSIVSRSGSASRLPTHTPLLHSPTPQPERSSTVKPNIPATDLPDIVATATLPQTTTPTGLPDTTPPDQDGPSSLTATITAAQLDMEDAARYSSAVPRAVSAAGHGVAVVAVAAAVALVPGAMSPGAVGAPARFSALAELLLCSELDDPPLTVLPWRPVIQPGQNDVSTMAERAVAVALISLVIACAGAFSLFVGAGTTRAEGWRRGLAEAAVIVPCFYAGPAVTGVAAQVVSTFAQSMALLTEDGEDVAPTATDVLVSVVACGVVLVHLGVMARVTLRPPPSGENAASVVSEQNESKWQALQRFLHSLLCGGARRAPTRRPFCGLAAPEARYEDQAPASTLVPTWIRSVAVLEVAVAHLFELLAGARGSVDFCSGRAVAAAAVALLFVAYVGVGQPLEDRLEHGFQLALAVVQLAAGLLLVAAVMSNNSESDDSSPSPMSAWGEWLATCGLWLVVVQAIALAVVSVRQASDSGQVSDHNVGDDGGTALLSDVPVRVASHAAPLPNGHGQENRRSSDREPSVVANAAAHDASSRRKQNPLRQA